MSTFFTSKTPFLSIYSSKLHQHMTNIMKIKYVFKTNCE